MPFKPWIPSTHANQNSSTVADLLINTAAIVYFFCLTANVVTLQALFLYFSTISPSHSAEPRMAVGWKNIPRFRQWQTAIAYKDRLKPSLSVISLYVWLCLLLIICHPGTSAIALPDCFACMLLLRRRTLQLKRIYYFHEDSLYKTLGSPIIYYKMNNSFTVLRFYYALDV